MNVSGMIKKATKTVTASIVAFAAFGLGISAFGQTGTTTGDICSIEANSFFVGRTVTAPGTQITFTIRLGNAGSYPSAVYSLRYLGDGTEFNMYYDRLALKMSTGGWAYLDSVEPETSPANGRYNCNFVYTVREGDFGMPLTIAGEAGNSTNPGMGFTWKNTANYKVTVKETPSSTERDVVWRFGGGVSMMDKDDWTMAMSDVKVQTLKFNETEAYRVASGEELMCTISRQGTLSTDEAVGFALWSSDPSSFEVVGANESGIYATSIPSGESTVTFYIRGKSPETTANLCLGSVSGPDPDGRINWVNKVVQVTKAPDPTIKVVLTGGGTANQISTYESDTESHELRVTATEAPATNVVVTLTADPNYIQLSSNTLTILAGQNESEDVVTFLVLNETTTAYPSGVKITPACTDPKYLEFKSGTVMAQNLAPVIVTPTTLNDSAITLTEKSITYSVTDVSADNAAVTLRWNWGDSTEETTTNERSGTVKHTYTAPGDYLVTVYPTDGVTPGEPVQFHMIVKNPVAKPVLKPILVNPTDKYDENNREGEIKVSASAAYPAGAFNFKLKVTQADTDPAITNLYVAAAENETVLTMGADATETETGIPFKVIDGTYASYLQGVKVEVVPEDETVATYFDLRPLTISVRNVSPTMELPTVYSFTNALASNIKQTIPFRFSEPGAQDRDSVISIWTFSGGNTITNYGVEGSVTNTFTSSGVQTLTVKWADKDDIPDDNWHTSYFNLTIGNPPTISIAPGSMFIYENSTDVYSLEVELSTPFDRVVPVTLTVTPATSAGNGFLELAQTKIFIDANQRYYTVNLRPVFDGTQMSEGAGFVVTPSITPGESTSAAAAAFYSNFQSARINIKNVEPVINMPKMAANATEIAYTASQGIQRSIAWSVRDVNKDADGITVRFDWGDGTQPDILHPNALNGVASHTWNGFDVYTVTMTVTDKDGGSDWVQFYVSVQAAQTLMATPVGPNPSSKYYGLTFGNGLGEGKIVSHNAVSTNYINNVWRFVYGTGVMSASLEAIPATASDDERKNFFYAWDDFGGGQVAEALLNPTMSDPICLFPLGANDTGGVYQVRAIFSREYLIGDGKGDINGDGIPDDYQCPTTGHTIRDVIMAVTGTDPDTDVSLYATTGLRTTNPDGDVWPIDRGAAGLTVTDEKCAPFTTIQELRGTDEALNDPITGRTGDNLILDEPGAKEGSGGEEPVTRGSDPIEEDTDGDSIPDGYEYYFWRRAAIDGLTGRRYNPQDPGSSIVIESVEIRDAFNPLEASASGHDTDDDGLSDLEEFLLGTNPINWDTDGDGAPDGWEAARGSNPLRANGSDSNPDGDYMAFALVDRHLITVELDGETKTYLYKVGVLTNIVEEVITNVVDGVEEIVTTATTNVVENGNRTYYTCYWYGAPDTVLAQGHPVTELEVLGEIDEATGETYGQITSNISVEAAIMHFQVYQEFGFEPTVAWGNTRVDHNKEFTTGDEFLLCKFMMNVVQNVGAVNAQNWLTVTTHPRTPDTDANPDNYPPYDGMPDGWELYVSCGPTGTEMVISPWRVNDGQHPVEALSVDTDGDFLSNNREFAGTLSSAQYNNADLYQANVAEQDADNGDDDDNGNGNITIVRLDRDANWINKFWPTDPWRVDSDGDGLTDFVEQAFQYGTPEWDGVVQCVRGGGLNPNWMDTDRDALPDAWEYKYMGVEKVSEITDNTYIDEGMDGTHGPANYELTPQNFRRVGMGDAFSWSDPWVTGDDNIRRHMDWDNDGLENYQEYLVHAMRHFRYDYSEGQMPMDYDNYSITAFFHTTRGSWDEGGYSAMWDALVGMFRSPVYFLLPDCGILPDYVSTDPRNPDTDGDGMDDYYELFHGLNPILGELDLVSDANGGMMDAIYVNPWNPDATGETPLPMDFVKYPWLAGLDYADPDADGLLNLEEQIQANMAQPASLNTDPSPLWMTDVTSTNSLVLRFYRHDQMFFWDIPMMVIDTNFYYYSFEMNEGYDTDNDGVSDKNELIQNATSMSDPQDHDDVLRRQALWFDGEQSAASTAICYHYDTATFNSYTVELWAYPEDVSRDQVLIERPVLYPMSDASTTAEVVRVNFRIGISADGRVYGMYNNHGSHDEESGVVYAYGPQIEQDAWTHIALSLDGSAGQLLLYINGELQTTTITELPAANGVINQTLNPDSGTLPEADHYIDAPVVLGASHSYPTWELNEGPVWDNFSNFYAGYLDEVRVWDGARTRQQILENYRKRFLKADVEANRDEVQRSIKMGGSRINNATVALPSELIYCWNFDNLFAADSEDSVAVVPRGFDYQNALVNRPEGYEVGWWSQWETKSAIYTDYSYIPWIENTVGHLANYDGTVLNSRYWNRWYAGVKPTYGPWEFPNNNNPYGWYYLNDLTDGLAWQVTLEHPDRDNISSEMNVQKAVNFEYTTTSDLVPLGNAWAKQVAVMWDDGTPSSVWAETGTDSDADGLPDWWEEMVGEDLSWNDLYPDGSGMTAGERYIRDISNGYTQNNNPSAAGWDESALLVQSSDADDDGIPDWWENLYGLKSNSAEGENGANGDPDGDGLSNYAEYLVSEVYAIAPISPVQFKSNPAAIDSDYFIKVGSTYLGAVFADHDMMDDAWEDQYNLSAVSRYIYDSFQDADEDGWSNWSENRYGTHSLRSDPTRLSRTNPDGEKVWELPIPTVKVTAQYLGANKTGNVVVKAWSDPEMNGIPDAVWTLPGDEAIHEMDVNIGYWAKDKVIQGYLGPGSVLAGTVEFNMNDYTTVYVPQDSTNATENATEEADHIFAVDVANFPNDTGTLYMYENGRPNLDYPVGSIDYTSGKYELDLSVWTGSVYADTNDVVTASPTNSFITASYQYALTEDFPKTFYLTQADPSTAAVPSRGYLKEGLNYFMAFIDLSGDGNWNVNEPFAISETFATDIGWDLNKVNFDLRDTIDGGLRFSINGSTSDDAVWGQAAGSEGGGGEGTAIKNTRVRVYRTQINTFSNGVRRVVLDKILTGGRDSIHEGDFLAEGDFGFDWGFPGTTYTPSFAVYEVYLDRDADITSTNVMASYVFTNRFETAQATPTVVYPRGAYVYAARPTFKWSMPENYTAFNIQVRKAGTTSTLLTSGVTRAPMRTQDGVSVWTAPWYAGKDMDSNAVYEWRVCALNSKFTASANWSSWYRFRLDTAAPTDETAVSAGYGAIQAKVKYYGPVKALNGLVHVCAYDNAGFVGDPEAEIVLGSAETTMLTSTDEKAVNAQLNGLLPSRTAGKYYVMAYIDQNGNGVRDNWESWGYASHYGMSVTEMYDPLSVTVTASNDPAIVEVHIEDTDIDQDWFPDSWEYTKNPTNANFLDATAPNTSNAADTEINPYLASGKITLTQFVAINTLLELNLNTASGSMVSDEDTGISVLITALRFNSDGAPEVGVSVAKAGAQTLGFQTVEVVLEYTESLTNPNWIKVESDNSKVPVNGAGTTITGTESMSGKSGFFRLRVVK